MPDDTVCSVPLSFRELNLAQVLADDEESAGELSLSTLVVVGEQVRSTNIWYINRTTTNVGLALSHSRLESPLYSG